MLSKRTTLLCHCEPSTARSGIPCGGLCEAARTARAVFATSRSRCLTASRLVGNCLSGSAKWRTASTWAWSSISVGRRLLKGLSFIAASFGFQQFKQFVARHEQFTAQCPTHFEFTPLDEAVNAEIIDAQEISGLLDGIREPLGCGGRRWFSFRDCFHNHSISTFVGQRSVADQALNRFAFGARDRPAAERPRPADEHQTAESTAQNTEYFDAALH